MQATTSSPTTRPQREEGNAIVVVLLMSLVFALLGVTVLATALRARSSAVNEERGREAFNAADAGITHALAVLPGQNIDTLLAGGGSLLADQPLGFAASYDVTVRNNVSPEFPTGTVGVDSGGASNDTDGFVVVSSEGTSGTGRRVVEVIVQTGSSPFTHAIWSDAKITVSSSGGTDSYDSGLGPYDPLSPGSQGDVFSNTEVTLSGSSMINGDAETVGTVSDWTHVSGTVTETAPSQSKPIEPCPGGGYSTTVPPGPGVTYDSTTGVLKVSGGNSITLPVPPTDYYFSEVTLSGGSTLAIGNGGGEHVDIFISGKLDVSGGGLVNGTSAPTALGLWACGSTTQDWKLSGGSGAYFSVYAPNRKVEVSGSGHIWGAVVAGEFTSSGGSMVHFDLALSGGGGFSVLANSWREVF